RVGSPSTRKNRAYSLASSTSAVLACVASAPSADAGTGCCTLVMRDPLTRYISKYSDMYEDSSKAHCNTSRGWPRAPSYPARVVVYTFSTWQRDRLLTALPAHQLEVDPWPSPHAPVHPSSLLPPATSRLPPSSPWMLPSPAYRPRKAPGFSFPFASA